MTRKLCILYFLKVSIFTSPKRFYTMKGALQSLSACQMSSNQAPWLLPILLVAEGSAFLYIWMQCILNTSFLGSPDLECWGFVVHLLLFTSVSGRQIGSYMSVCSVWKTFWPSFQEGWREGCIKQMIMNNKPWSSSCRFHEKQERLCLVACTYVLQSQTLWAFWYRVDVGLLFSMPLAVRKCQAENALCLRGKKSLRCPVVQYLCRLIHNTAKRWTLTAGSSLHVSNSENSTDEPQRMR